MASPGAVVAPRPQEASERHRKLVDRGLIAAIFAVGIVPVALVLAVPNGLYGITEYDDGVYFAAALRLVSGILPYRHFVFVEPPGITVLLAPFALLAHLAGGREALAATRMFTALVAGANAALVASLLRRRGRFAMAVGGLAVAVFPTAYTADHTFLLEPFCVLFCLIGVRLVFSNGAVASARRCLLGGASVAFACDVKTFGVVILLGLFAVLAKASPRRAGAFAIGVAVVVAVAVLPFFLAAPHAFVHQVIVSQLTRGTARPTPLINRFFALTGLAFSAPSLSIALLVPGIPHGDAPTLAASSALGAIIVVLGLRLLAGRERSPLSWFVVIGALLAAATALGPPAYFGHYADFPAPFLALALGEGAALLSGLLAPRAGRALRSHLSKGLAGTGWLVLGGGALAVLLVSGGYHQTIARHFGDDGPTIAAIVPPGACVIADSESFLVSAGRAFPVSPNCPQIIDSSGTWLAADPANPPYHLVQPFAEHFEGKDPALVAQWSNAFATARYVVLSGCTAFRIPWTAALLEQFERNYRPLPSSHVYELRRRPLATIPPGGLPTSPKCLLP